MKAEGKTRAVLEYLLCAVLIAFIAASVWAAVSDYQSLAVVSKGVTLVGRDLSGMTRDQVRTAIDESVSAPMMRPIAVTGSGGSWSLDPKGIVTLDVESMVDQAYAPTRDASIVRRVFSRIAGEPLPADVQPVHSVATATLAAWVRQTAALVDTAPVNAKRRVVKYQIRITPAVYGASVDQTKAVDLIAQTLTDDAALASASRAIALPIDAVTPKVTESSFGRAIVVSISQRRVRLFNGAKLVKTYPCAPGRPAWPTPTGDFSIVRKLANAPWYNPHSTWSASMPDVIPGGPGNPMGDRKIGIDSPGIFLHGIPASEYSSIGTAASHGCMRMMPSAVHDLYGRIKVGDPVFIRS
jgi:lipoprotein-anchoring transpeptidase ErfK/SrfK